MLTPRWTYSNGRCLTQWYGHVDYYDRYIVGQWFALDAETGKEHWHRKFFRPTTVCDCVEDVIVACETRSDGPWTFDFGIYGIDARSGRLIWVNHGTGLWGIMLRAFDYIPGFTNEFRDVAVGVVGTHVFTARGRVLDISTGRRLAHSRVSVKKNDAAPPAERRFYDAKSVELDGDTLAIEGCSDDCAIFRCNRQGEVLWRFTVKDYQSYLHGNYYSYRLHDGHILMILGDGPNTVPIGKGKSAYVGLNRANYQMGILDLATGRCSFFPLIDAARRTECRIEAILGSRVLVSCDQMQLTEYEMSPNVPESAHLERAR